MAGPGLVQCLLRLLITVAEVQNESDFWVWLIRKLKIQAIFKRFQLWPYDMFRTISKGWPT